MMSTKVHLSPRTLVVYRFLLMTAHLHDFSFSSSNANTGAYAPIRSRHRKNY